MSNRHQGAQPGVQRALGWTPEPRSVNTGVIRCACGGKVRLEVEAFGIGRTIEVCDTCGSRQFTSGDIYQDQRVREIAREDRARQERSARVKATLRELRKHSPKHIKPKICENPTCGKQYEPKSGNQKYCGAGCRLYDSCGRKVRQ